MTLKEEINVVKRRPHVFITCDNCESVTKNANCSCAQNQSREVKSGSNIFLNHLSEYLHKIGQGRSNQRHTLHSVKREDEFEYSKVFRNVKLKCAPNCYGINSKESYTKTEEKIKHVHNNEEIIEQNLLKTDDKKCLHVNINFVNKINFPGSGCSNCIKKDQKANVQCNCNWKLEDDKVQLPAGIEGSGSQYCVVISPEGETTIFYQKHGGKSDKKKKEERERLIQGESDGSGDEEGDLSSDEDDILKSKGGVTCNLNDTQLSDETDGGEVEGGNQIKRTSMKDGEEDDKEKDGKSKKSRDGQDETDSSSRKLTEETSSLDKDEGLSDVDQQDKDASLHSGTTDLKDSDNKDSLDLNKEIDKDSKEGTDKNDNMSLSKLDDEPTDVEDKKIPDEGLELEKTGEEDKIEPTSEEYEGESTGEEREKELTGEGSEKELSGEGSEKELSGEESGKELTGEVSGKELTGERSEEELTADVLEGELVSERYDGELGINEDGTAKPTGSMDKMKLSEVYSLAQQSIESAKKNWTKDIEYLEREVGNYLIKSMAEIGLVKANDPVNYLGERLYKHRRMEDCRIIADDEKEDALLNRQMYAMSEQKIRTFNTLKKHRYRAEINEGKEVKDDENITGNEGDNHENDVSDDKEPTENDEENLENVDNTVEPEAE